MQDEIAICGQTSVTQMPLPSLARESAPIECQRSSVRAEPSLSVCPITNDYAPPSRNARFLASRVRSACRPDLQDLYTEALMRMTSSSHRVQFQVRVQRGRYPFTRLVPRDKYPWHLASQSRAVPRAQSLREGASGLPGISAVFEKHRHVTRRRTETIFGGRS